MEEGTETDGKRGEHGKILTKEEEKKEGLKQWAVDLCCGFSFRALGVFVALDRSFPGLILIRHRTMTCRIPPPLDANLVS